MNNQNKNIITSEQLKQLGVNLSSEVEQSLIEHLTETINQKIGEEIIDDIDDEQADELLALQQTGSDEDVANWIKANVPDYKEIVEDNIAITIGELAENANKI